MAAIQEQNRETDPQAHIRNTEDGFVHGNHTETQLALLKRLVASENGLPVLLYGPAGSGKSALLAVLERDTGERVVRVCADEVERGGSEYVRKAMRRAYTVRLQEQLRIVEGEVLSIGEDKITLKTVDMESVFDIGTRIRQDMVREQVSVGDVIRVYKDAGFVTRIGRSRTKALERTGPLQRHVDAIEGECCRTEDTVSELSLDELDMLNSRECGEKLLYTGIMANETVQREVDRKVGRWLQEGKGSAMKGVLVICNADRLSEKLLSYILGSKGHQPFRPLIVLEGESFAARLRDSLLSIRMGIPEQEALAGILMSRASYLSLSPDADALELLVSLATSQGIATAMSVLETSAGSSYRGHGHEPSTVSAESIQNVMNLFIFGDL